MEEAGLRENEAKAAPPSRGTGGSDAGPGAGIGTYLFLHGVVGFLNGYLILHPVAMVIFRSLEGPMIHMGHGGATQGHPVWGAIVHSFELSMLPMGLLFGLVGTVIAVVYGYQSCTIKRHVEDLAHQLDVNAGLTDYLRLNAATLESQNVNLRELERHRERTTDFMVHDFKGYLACIGGFARQALKNAEVKSNTGLSDALVRIQRQSEQMLADTRSLLDISRLQEVPVLRKRRVAPGQLLDQVLDDLALHGQRNMIEIDKSGGDCPMVMAEPGLLKRVLWNLAVNAFKHNRAGTRVVLGAEPDSARENAVFTCADDGQGMPEEELPRLFADFQTGNPLADVDSLGLGLAFCKTAVEAHGGRIWCDSEIGRGTRFCFSIPYEKGEDNGEQQG